MDEFQQEIVKLEEDYDRIIKHIEKIQENYLESLIPEDRDFWDMFLKAANVALECNRKELTERSLKTNLK